MTLRSFSRAELHLWETDGVAGARPRCNEVLCLGLAAHAHPNRVIGKLQHLLGTAPRLFARAGLEAGWPAWSIEAHEPIPTLDRRIGSGALRPACAAASAALLAQACQEERRHPFDLSTELPVRLSILEAYDPGAVNVLLTFHPLVMGGSQLDSLFETLRIELADTTESPLPPEALCRVAVASGPSRPGTFEEAGAHDSSRTDESVYEAFRAQARRLPSSVALIEGQQHVSFGTLDSTVTHLAACLVASGVEAGDRVGVYMARSIPFVASVLAILRRRAVYVPIDPDASPADVRHIAREMSLVAVLHARDDFASGLDVRALIRATPVPARESTDEAAGAAGIPAYLIQTSGSTGSPKGTLGSHTGIINRVLWARRALNLADGDVFCLKTRVGCVDHVAEMFQPLLTGGSLLIQPETETTGAPLVEALAARCVTHLSVLPLQLEALLAVPQFHRLRTLRSMVCSGDTLPLKLARRCFAALPQARIFNVYGLTEAGADSTCYEIPYDGESEFAPFFTESATRQRALPPTESVPVEPRPWEEITRAGVTLDDLKVRFSDSTVPVKLSSLDEYRRWLDELVLPYTVNVGAGRFVGHMTSALPDFMPELSALVARLNQNMVKVETSKALTLLERQLLTMLHREIFNSIAYEQRAQNAEDVFGLVVSGGSTANLTSLWNARNRALLRLGFDKSELTRQGAFALLQRAGYEGFAIIASRLAHYSIRKAASLMGIGEENLLFVKQTPEQKVDLQDLELTIRTARARRRLIIALVGIAGATETGTIDPLPQMSAIAKQHNIHFHVDAAWGGAIVFSDRHRALLDGIQDADTITLCPHKQLFVPQGMSLCLFKDPRAIHASSIQAVYQGRRGSFDAGQYTIEGSRPAAFLFLHAMFHLISRRGIGALVDQGIEKTRFFADVIERHEAFELVGSPTINILNYRYIRPSLRHKSSFTAAEQRQISQDIAKIQERQFLRGATFVSRTDILHPAISSEPITVFRVVIANPLTTRAHLLDTLADQLDIAATVIDEPMTSSAADERLSLELLAREPQGRIERYAAPIGKAIPNTELLILSAQGLPQPVGVVGEIHVGGCGLALGYLNAAETAEAFVPHPLRPGARLFRTGDFGRRLADGTIELAGRKDQQIKIRGLRVRLTDIEASLCRLEAVKHCTVLAEPGENDTLLVAFIVPSPPAQAAEAELSVRALRQQLLGSLPSYMVPEVLHVLDELPCQPGGKIDRQRLRALYRNQLAHRPRRTGSVTEARLASVRAVGEGRA